MTITMNDFFDGEWKSSEKPLYTKIQGEVRLRVLSKAILGWEGWYKNKPIRFKYDYKISTDEYDALDKDNYDPSKAKWKQFAVCVVWNYTEGCPQFWQFSQKQIKDQLLALAADTDWGNITNYDIKVKREGEKMETKYSITPLPAKEVSEEIKAEVIKRGLSPEQIFDDKKNAENVANFKAMVKVDEIPF